MTHALLYLLTGLALWLLGLHGLLSQRHALRRIIAVNIMGSGVFTKYSSFCGNCLAIVSN